MALRVTPPPRLPDLRGAPGEIANWRAFQTWMTQVQQWQQEVYEALAATQDSAIATASTVTTQVVAVGDLQTSLGAVQTDVGALQGDVTTLQGDVSTVSTAVSAVETSVGSLETSVAALESAITPAPQTVSVSGDVSSTSFATMASASFVGLVAGDEARVTVGITGGLADSGTGVVSWRIIDVTSGTVLRSGTVTFDTAGPVAMTSLLALPASLLALPTTPTATVRLQMAKTSSLQPTVTSVAGSMLVEILR